MFRRESPPIAVVQPLLLLSVFLAACPGKEPPVTVFAPDEPHFGLEIAIGDLIDDLGRVHDAQISRASLPAPECSRGEIYLVPGAKF